ncbi:MAG: protein-disulfide reductase DsbD domain-containing protein, partial [Dysgonamonadaceae bacterium]
MKKKKLLVIIVFLLGLSSIALAQNEVAWKFSIKDKGNGEIHLVSDATIKRGWHLYDTNIPDGGPYPTSLTIDEIVGATPIGGFHAEGKEAVVTYDKVFEMNIGTFDNSAKFVQAFKVTDKKAFKLTGDVRAQACDDKSCTPPLPVDFAFTSTNLPATVAEMSTEKGSVAAEP